jgi:hypothetical protein
MAMTRIQLELPAERLQELEQLMQQTDLDTKKDLLNSALTLFEWAVKERQAGRTLASIDEQTQRYREIVLPALERAAAKKDKQSAGV